jgi:hypothetical protein
LIPYRGDYQAAKVNTAFQQPLQVLVASRFYEPVDGGVIRYAGPKSGPGVIPQESVQTIEKGAASLQVKANDIAGIYNVKTYTRGCKLPFWFHLANIE